MRLLAFVTVLAAATLPSAYTVNLRTMETMDTMGLISMHGWRPKEYVLQTADGYLLRLHRIKPSGANGRERRVPVLVQHGLLCASDTWVLRGRQDLVFMLMEAGYDVWLGNVRGNNYCKSHVRLNDTADPFWDYSFHEMGVYDVPAMIDFILAKNGAPQLFYIGHSMGTTMFYVMASSRPEYNSKVRAMISLAPVAFQAQYPPMLKQLGRHRWQIWEMLNKQGIHQVWPRMPWLSAAEANLCRDGSPFQTICLELVFAVTGRDYKQFNKTMIPMIIHHLSSTNPRTLAHYGQNVVSGRFQWFDYGPKLNQKVYGNKEAPDYNLSRITTPVALYYSTNDFLSYEKDVMKLASSLPNLVGVFKVPYRHFNHIDYLWGNDADSLLYKDILHLMSKL